MFASTACKQFREINTNLTKVQQEKSAAMLSDQKEQNC